MLSTRKITHKIQKREHPVKSSNNTPMLARKQANYCKIIYGNNYKLPLILISAADISHIYKNIYDLSYASYIANEEVK